MEPSKLAVISQLSSVNWLPQSYLLDASYLVSVHLNFEQFLKSQYLVMHSGLHLVEHYAVVEIDDCPQISSSDVLYACDQPIEDFLVR